MKSHYPRASKKSSNTLTEKKKTKNVFEYIAPSRSFEREREREKEFVGQGNQKYKCILAYVLQTQLRDELFWCILYDNRCEPATIFFLSYRYI